MPTWKLTLSYDGTGFHGWQVQPGLPSVQQTLSDAVERAIGERVMPQGSGRTDAGVHALGQVASFGTAADLPAANLQRALNRSLPRSIRVLRVEAASPNFHARYSAIAKTYEYRIFECSTGDAESAAGDAPDKVCSPFLAPFVWNCRWTLDRSALQGAAAYLRGTHDFASFAASDPEKTKRAAAISGQEEIDTVRTVMSSEWSHEEIGGEALLIYRVTGNGFLHHMVRNLVGTMVDVGRGSLNPEAMPGILAARDRTAAGPTAPACGLFLHSVKYAEDSHP